MHLICTGFCSKICFITKVSECKWPDEPPDLRLQCILSSQRQGSTNRAAAQVAAACCSLCLGADYTWTKRRGRIKAHTQWTSHDVLGRKDLRCDVNVQRQKVQRAVVVFSQLVLSWERVGSGFMKSVQALYFISIFQTPGVTRFNCSPLGRRCWQRKCFLLETGWYELIADAVYQFRHVSAES